MSFKALRRTRGEEICGQEANSLIGFHRRVPLLPSLTPRAKASSSWRFLSCLFALLATSSPPGTPLFSSASMLARLGSHRLSISSEERCGAERWALCSRRCWQQASEEAVALLQSPLTQDGDWWQPAQSWLCIWSKCGRSTEEEEQGGTGLSSGRPEGRSVPHTMAFFHTPKKEERETGRERER